MSEKKIVVLHSKSLKEVFTLTLKESSTVRDAKLAIQRQKSYLYPDRILLKSEQNGKPLNDEDKLGDTKLFFKDLGPQVGWKTVFLTEYAGPLFIYLIFYLRPAFIYGTKQYPYDLAANLGCILWVFHYAKRILETIFVHRFSHSTMPIRNIFKNSIYYWGFAAFVAYYTNHPLYTRPFFGNAQIIVGLVGFLLSEYGNFSIHILLRDLRPAGSKVRKIPYPTSNPFTLLFNFVSCPNYTYEIFSWIFFSIMTQSVPVLLFTLAGGYQMVIWALGKHRNYRKEFEKNYPKRKSIIPFII